MMRKIGAGLTSSSFATIRGAIRINIIIPARITRRVLICGRAARAARMAAKATRQTSGIGEMTPKRSISDGRNAFTLMELMVVVVLIGILSAVIIPEMRGTYEEAVLRSTSRELVNAFNI